NVLLAAVAFAPSLPSAIALLLARHLLSQADVPTRQAYVVAVVSPRERTAAIAATNTVRYLTRPIAPLLAGEALRAGLGAPFLVAGLVKSVYDLGLYALFRTVPYGRHTDPPERSLECPANRSRSPTRRC